MAIHEKVLGGLISRAHETMCDRWKIKNLNLVRRDELDETVVRIPRYQIEQQEVNQRLEQLDRAPLRSRISQFAFVITNGEF